MLYVYIHVYIPVVREIWWVLCCRGCMHRGRVLCVCLCLRGLCECECIKDSDRVIE
jgi:hypothetical protein